MKNLTKKHFISKGIKEILINIFLSLGLISSLIGCVAGDLEKEVEDTAAAESEKTLAKIGSIVVKHSQSGFNIPPAPKPFVAPAPVNKASPFKRNDPPINLLIAVDNPLTEQYIHEWFRNGNIILTEQNAVSAINIDPSNGSVWPIGPNTIVSKIIDPSNRRVVDSKTWTFVINDIDEPIFSFNFAPLPVTVPITKTSDGIKTIEATTITNIDNKSYFVKWFLDGAEQTSGPYPEKPSVSFAIDPTDKVTFPVGNHTLYLEVLESVSGPIIETNTWSFEVGYDDPTTITGGYPVNPSVVQDPPPANGHLDTTITDPNTDKVFLINTLIHAVSGNALDETLNENGRGGFFIAPNPVDNGTRGKLVHDFCVYVADGTGLNNEGVSVVFYDELGTTITPDGTTTKMKFNQVASPDPVCLSGYGKAFGNGNANYSKQLNPVDSLSESSSKQIRAVVKDNFSQALIGEIIWDNLTITPANTTPIISIDSNGNNVDPTQTIEQGGPLDYEFVLDIKDKDSSNMPINPTDYSIQFSIKVPTNSSFVVMDGAGSGSIFGSRHWSGSDFAVPDCDWTSAEGVATKFKCPIRFPNFNDPNNTGSSVPVAPGEYRIKATVTDTQTNGTDGPARQSSEVEWVINVTEKNSAPTIFGTITPGLGATSAASTGVNTFVYDIGNPTQAVGLASENDAIKFNIVVNDLERDDHKIEVFFKGSDNDVVDAAFTQEGALTLPLVAHTIDKQTSSISWTLPRNLLTGNTSNATCTLPAVAPSVLNTCKETIDIEFKVVVTDIPSDIGTTALTDSKVFPIRLTNQNPAPILTQSGIGPALITDHRVMEGFPFSIYPGEISDSSPLGSDGTNVEYKWQAFTQITTLACDGGGIGWTNIDGATGSFANTISNPQPSSLVWTPPASLFGPSNTLPLASNNNKVCFRVCVGDDGLGNNKDDHNNCIVWKGLGSPIDNAGLVRLVNKVESEVVTTNGTSRGHALWYDDDITITTWPKNVYVAYHVDENLFVKKMEIDNNGSITGPILTSAALPSDGGSTSSFEFPLEISITGNNSYIYVSYRIDEDSTLPVPEKVPLLRVYRLDKGTMANGQFIPIQTVASTVGQIVATNNAWYIPFVRVADNNEVSIAHAAAAVNTATIQELTSNFEAIKINNVFDGINNQIVIAKQGPNGSVSLFGYIPDLNTPYAITNPAVAANATVIPAPFTNYEMAIGNGSNPKVFLMGKNASNQLLLSRRDLATLNSEVAGDLLGSPAEFLNLNGFKLVAGEALNELFVLSSITTDIKLVKVEGVTAVAASSVSRKVNTANSDVLNNLEIASSPLILNLKLGTVQAGSSENVKNTIFVNYFDDSDKIQSLILNSEQVVVPYSAAGAIWGMPIFK